METVEDRIALQLKRLARQTRLLQYLREDGATPLEIARVEESIEIIERTLWYLRPRSKWWQVRGRFG
jgi:hypothetical protein